MAQRLSHLGRKFELHYVVRERATAPLLDHMEITPMGEMARIATYFSRDPGGSRPDVEAIVRNVPAGTQIYCCGPGGIHVFAPDATCLGVLHTPEYVANFAWGDADYRSLYITASSSLYRVRTRIAGRSQWR